MRTEVLRMDNVTMRQWGITQMEHFNFQVYGGEIMGLMTVNSHGVEALLSLLQSNPPIHFGRVYYREELINSHIYSKATPNAIEVVEQRSHLVNGLTVADNVFVLSGAHRRWVVRSRSFKRRLQILEQTVGVEISYDRLAEDLSFFERCMVELLKAAEAGVRLVVLRDMGHYLAGEDIDRLHRAVRYFTSCGMSFLYISNSYEELGRICDRMAVMYNGTVIHVADRASWERGRVAALLEKLTGAAAVPPKSAPAAGHIGFAMHGVRTAALRGIDLSVLGANVWPFAPRIGPCWTGCGSWPAEKRRCFPAKCCWTAARCASRWGWMVESPILLRIPRNPCCFLT
ncbi:MAG: hypothetical protein HFF17_06825 [Oscillospiraceae bacterium]|nr:hypothetical protein [Oscillospiraceae bacterium]